MADGRHVWLWILNHIEQQVIQHLSILRAIHYLGFICRVNQTVQLVESDGKHEKRSVFLDHDCIFQVRNGEGEYEPEFVFLIEVDLGVDLLLEIRKPVTQAVLRHCGQVVVEVGVVGVLEDEHDYFFEVLHFELRVYFPHVGHHVIVDSLLDLLLELLGLLNEDGVVHADLNLVLHHAQA